ncbi:protein strawberry notch homolog 1-like [Plectropomus leopardus]|uniref:protein strawberry notch homolog 1-like n=1 Tax=Plectropomus leopardus TaxID=160734 RepID=UPI001C4CAC10|nr:protein strawberry notch homolog 1-like [Plectropomus leopardus]
MDPGQDLLLAALSESGICPNDIGLFDVDSQDVAQPSTTQQSISISALDVGAGTESVEVVRPEPPAPVPIVTIRHKPQPSTTTFVLNQLNQLPSLGAAVTKQSVTNPIKHTITVTKVVHVANSALRGSSTPSSTSIPPSASTVVPSNRDQQIQLKDLLRPGNVKSTGLKGNSLMELMKLKPPPNIAPPVATATATGEMNNGIKKEVLGKDAARNWINDDIKVQTFSHSLKIPGMKEEDEPEEEEEEELGHAETYAEYMPMKLKIGLRHPDPVVETSSLSSVNPPDVWYRLSIPEEVIDRGCLSALQLEAITYAAQQHETFLPSGDRAAYLIGDGAGVGKGRTIAGIIYENYLLGRKRSLWFSVSNDLKYDAERDLRDIGAKNIQVHSLNKFKYGKISSKHNGSVKKGVIFATYSSLIGESQSGGKYKTRFQQLLHWCGEDFDGVIVYDECHKAKNVCPIGSSKPTKTGLAVLELQNKLPNARVVYASATGASEPRNMAYMNRLGIWGHKTPFREFGNFIQAVERRGVGAMEIVAMDMKLRGMYIARQLSFTGVTFKIEEVPLTQQYIHMYNKSVRLWVKAREKFQQAANLMDAEQRMKKSMWGQFWSAHQRFFKYLCIASKVRRVVQLAREEVQNGKCVVIGLQSTGEARTLEALEEGGGELNDFVSTAKGVLQSLIEKHFPAPDRQKLYSLLGIDLSAKKTPSPTETAAKPEQKGKKRKDHGSVRKEQKKGKERRRKKEEGEYRSRPIKVAFVSLWACGSTRPTFTAPVIPPSTLPQMTVEKVVWSVTVRRQHQTYESRSELDVPRGNPQSHREAEVHGWLREGWVCGEVRGDVVGGESDACDWADQNGPEYMVILCSDFQMRNNKKTAILVKEVNTKKRLFLVYRPNTGRQLKLETYADIKKKFKKVLSEDAKQHWTDQYKLSAKICSHAYWRGNCKKAAVGLQCEVGLRCRTYYVLCGSVLSVWNELEEVLTPVSGTNVKVQIVRLRTEDGQRIVGLIIPANCVSPLCNKLSTSDQCQQLAVQELQKLQQLHPQSLSHAPNT